MNPWENISLSDYENHMQLASVMQLQVMNAMMREQFESFPVETAMVLGVAAGNGLEHVDPRKYCKIYGIDINKKYLQAAQERHKHLSGVLECMQIDLEKDSGDLPQAELLIANLLIEYIGYKAFQRVVKQVQPRYISCIIQANTDTTKWVSDSPFLHAFDALDAIHHALEKDTLVVSLQSIDYRIIQSSEYPLPNNKRFVRVEFETKYLKRL